MDAFGTMKSGSQSSLHLTTKDYDEASGLYYFGARWYDRSTGKWIEKEPYKMDGPNLYHFNLNSLIQYFDSTDLKAIVTGGGADWNHRDQNKV